MPVGNNLGAPQRDWVATEYVPTGTVLPVPPYAPHWSLKQGVLSLVPLVIGVRSRQRDIVQRVAPALPVPVRRSIFEPLSRGFGIFNTYDRLWYWRHPRSMTVTAEVMGTGVDHPWRRTSLHSFPPGTGAGLTASGLPGGVKMGSRPRLTRVLGVSAYSTAPPTVPVESS